MKTLSVRQPAASEIASGRKRIEYRTWKTNYRGPLLIAASQKKSGDLPTGCALCVVDLVDITGCEGDYRWHLENVCLVDNVPIKGRLNLYETPDDLIKVTGKASAQEEERKTAPAERKRKQVVVQGGVAAAIRKRKGQAR